MYISDLRKGDYKLPNSVINIDLKKSLNAYDESKHLIPISGQVDKHFNKRLKFPFTPSEMKSDKKWTEVGIRPDGLDYQTIDEKIRKGRSFDTYAWIPNDKVFTNTIHNRGDNVMNSICKYFIIRNPSISIKTSAFSDFLINSLII